VEQDIEALKRRFSPLALRRMALGITLKTLQQNTGIARQYLNQIERGVNWPKPTLIVGLAEGMGMTPTEVFDLLLATWTWKRENAEAA